MSLRGHRLLTGSVLAALSLALAGCNKAADDGANASAAALPALPATLPMTDAPAQQAALAPPPAAIPAARTIRTVRVADPRAAYAYADQAGYFSQSLGDGPPDYGFDYDGVNPWAWQGYDGSRVFLEPVDGGYRYYYYRAGADRPYFVRDPDYGYGYDGDQLAAIYGPDGALVPYGDYGPRAGYAAAYLWRAERLFEASRERRAISAASWSARQDSIMAFRERWAANRDRQADWAAYHAEESAQQSRYWAEESARRDADAQRYAAWRQQDFRTPPPPRAIPPRWQQASWAQDSARYAPIAAAAAGAGALALVAHHHQEMTADRDASRQPAFAVPPRQPMASPRAPAPVQAEQERRFGPSARQPDQGPRIDRPASRPDGRPAFAAHGPDAARRPPEARHEFVRPAPETRNREEAIGPRAAPDRPNMRSEEQIVTVHRGSEGAPRSVPSAPQSDERHAAAPRAEMANAPPPRRAPEAAHPPSAPPRAPQAAEQHGNSHPDAGHPAGGHPPAGDRDDHRR